jgi:hypothetical protein
MRLIQTSDGRRHPADGGPSDHHRAPTSVSFSNTTQSLPPGTAFDLDIALGAGDYQIARALLIGPRLSTIAPALKECAELVATRSAGQAMGHWVKAAGLFLRVYSATYSKQNADANLTDKVFNSGTSTQYYIAAQDAVLTGSVLRITFRNYYAGSVTLNVRGQALLW